MGENQYRDLPILLQSKGFEFVKKNNNPDYSLREVYMQAKLMKIDSKVNKVLLYNIK